MIDVTLGCQARLLDRVGRREEALTVLEGLLTGQRSRPEQSTVTPCQASLLAELDGPEWALPNGLPRTRWHQACTLLASGDLHGAAERFRALGADADEAECRLRLAGNLADQGRAQEAGQQLVRVESFARRAAAERLLEETERLRGQLRTPPVPTPTGPTSS